MFAVLCKKNVKIPIKNEKNMQSRNNNYEK